MLVSILINVFRDQPQKNVFYPGRHQKSISRTFLQRLEFLMGNIRTHKNFDNGMKIAPLALIR